MGGRCVWNKFEALTLRNLQDLDVDELKDFLQTMLLIWKLKYIDAIRNLSGGSVR